MGFGNLTLGKSYGVTPMQLAQGVDHEKIQNAAGAVLQLPKHAPLSEHQGKNLCINCA